MKHYKKLKENFILRIALVLILGLVAAIPERAECISGEELYKQLSSIANGKGDVQLLKTLNDKSKKLDWSESSGAEFVGHLRIIRPAEEQNVPAWRTAYLLRKISGEIFILSLPDDPAMLSEGANSNYAGLNEMYKDKMTFKVETAQSVINGRTYDFARLSAPPKQLLLDKTFKIFIILLLFFVMVGMGMTLTMKDFSLVFAKPRGILIGQILQFGVMPLMALGLGLLAGFDEHYPFIFAGLILISVIPGGVTSNLMTYYAKGDLALSISLTSFSSVLSIVFTPLLLSFYCSNMPDVNVPVMVVAQTIMILVIIPLAVGMLVKKKWTAFAEKATPFFSALGMLALLVLIVAGVLGNLNIFMDTARHGVKFYSTIFALTFLGMIVGIIGPKLIGINNYQTRAISLETGLRNASLAMTVALLIQDAMGDFHSAMFITSGIFGLSMYLAGIISIFLYKPLLPVADKEAA